MTKKFDFKFTIITFSLIILFIVGLLLYFNNTAASNKVLNEYYSPDNKTKVVVFERDAGATTGFSTQVSLISTKSSLGNKGGNIFIIDTNHGKAPSGKGGGPEVIVSWEGNQTVVLSYNKNARIFKQIKRFNNTQINYKSF